MTTNSKLYLDDVPKELWKNYIGNGYRYVTYTTDVNRKGQIILFGFDLSGERLTFVCPWESYIKYNVKYLTEEKDMYGNYVATKYFPSAYARKKYIEGASGLNIVECMKPEQEFLHYMFDDIVLDPSFNKLKIRVFSLDIENEISDSFMPPSEAGNRINMITIFDNFTEKFYTWSLEHAEIDFKDEPLSGMSKDKFMFFEFHNNETLMMEHFIKWWEENYPDVISGWNIRAYDMPYIVRRIENILGKSAAERLSPISKYRIKEVNHENMRATVGADIEIDISGISLLDSLILYRDKFNIKAALDGGYGLSNVGEAENLGRKIEYDGSLKDLYLKDYLKFYEYNVRDVDLCKRIDDKCKMNLLARQITSFGLCNFETIYSSISYLIGSVISFAKTNMGGVVFNSYLATKLQFHGFEGAFVFPAMLKIFRGGIACIDFASLYPSNIRAINASPETFVGKLLFYRKDESGNITCNIDNEEPVDVNDDAVVRSSDIVKIELKTANGTRKQITVDLIRDLLNTKCIYTPNNTLFLKHEIKNGVIAKWCEHFYGLRKSTKKKEMAIFHDLHNPELTFDAKTKEKMETDEENYHATLMALKTMINSIYGMLGTPFSPIANPDIALTVTRMGRMCNVKTSEFIKKMFIEKFNADENYTICASGDTDSQFINLECVSQYLIKKFNLSNIIAKWDQKYRLMLWDIMEKITEDKINPYVRNLVHEYCHTNNLNVLTYELEYMSDVGIYEAKKHYATHKIFEEGDPVNKTKYSGIELKKASIPKLMKTFLLEIYEGVLLNNWNESDYLKYVNDLYSKFKSFTIDEISIWKGYNTEREAAGFLEMVTGTTGIAKACIYYNLILEKMGLGKKYDQIMVGNKVRFTYLKSNNEYRINCIAYPPDQWPTEFDKVFEIDYHLMFEKIIMDPLRLFRKSCGFAELDPDKLTYEDFDEL